MPVRSLFAILAFVSVFFALPATAASGTVTNPNHTPVAATLDPASAEACLANAKGSHLAQINCCAGHKGVCGCRAGKIICCDGTASTEPGCTCHGDEGFIE